MAGHSDYIKPQLKQSMWTAQHSSCLEILRTPQTDLWFEPHIRTSDFWTGLTVLYVLLLEKFGNLEINPGRLHRRDTVLSLLWGRASFVLAAVSSAFSITDHTRVQWKQFQAESNCNNCNNYKCSKTKWKGQNCMEERDHSLSGILVFPD